MRNRVFSIHLDEQDGEFFLTTADSNNSIRAFCTYGPMRKIKDLKEGLSYVVDHVFSDESTINPPQREDVETATDEETERVQGMMSDRIRKQDALLRCQGRANQPQAE